MSKPRNDCIHLAKARLDWANAGINRLEILVNEFLATKPCEVLASVKRKGEDAHFSYVLRIHRQPPPQIRFAAGDVVHNLRATLDNLVWSIGKVYGAHDNFVLEFHSSRERFTKCYLPEVRKLPTPIRDWITSVQPYHGRNYPTLFNALHNLWNRDKHRTPLVINTAGITGTIGYVGERNPMREMRFFHTGGQKDQEKIATAVVPWELRHDFKPEFVSLVSFNVTGPVGKNIVERPEGVVEYLRHIQGYMLTKVVPKFEPYFS